MWEVRAGDGSSQAHLSTGIPQGDPLLIFPPPLTATTTPPPPPGHYLTQTRACRFDFKLSHSNIRHFVSLFLSLTHTRECEREGENSPKESFNLKHTPRSFQFFHSCSSFFFLSNYVPHFPPSTKHNLFMFLTSPTTPHHSFSHCLHFHQYFLLHRFTLCTSSPLFCFFSFAFLHFISSPFISLHSLTSSQSAVSFLPQVTYTSPIQPLPHTSHPSLFPHFASSLSLSLLSLRPPHLRQQFPLLPRSPLALSASLAD